ncbi:hypothetical protein M0Q97_11340 [Candidatus Dojkabacteria bacterium]|jgi:hypothetical protein|nr:hypothetical protein [Candidatus Dojkabacteria bacterium]
MINNKITILGEEFFYIEEDINAAGRWYTIFYQHTTTIIEKRKKYVFFGRTIMTEKKYPKILFSVPYHIRDNDIDKYQLRKNLEHEVSVLHRKKEIQRGEII